LKFLKFVFPGDRIFLQRLSKSSRPKRNNLGRLSNFYVDVPKAAPLIVELMNAATIQRLREREAELMARFESKAQGLKRAHPEWSIARCRGKAVMLMPQTYAFYLDNLNEMKAYGLVPKLEKGDQ
jgi:hypothetical protein